MRLRDEPADGPAAANRPPRVYSAPPPAWKGPGTDPRGLFTPTDPRPGIDAHRSSRERSCPARKWDGKTIPIDRCGRDARAPRTRRSQDARVRGRGRPRTSAAPIRPNRAHPREPVPQRETTLELLAVCLRGGPDRLVRLAGAERRRHPALRRRRPALSLGSSGQSHLGFPTCRDGHAAVVGGADDVFCPNAIALLGSRLSIVASPSAAQAPPSGPGSASRPG